jgi:hypothetical protein
MAEVIFTEMNASYPILDYLMLVLAYYVTFFTISVIRSSDLPLQIKHRGKDRAAIPAQTRNLLT